MLPQIVRYRIWDLALRMNPQTATYSARVSTPTPGGTDTFWSYGLQRLVYRELNSDEIQMAGITLDDVYKVWTICQVDLDNATPLSANVGTMPAPTPQISYELTIQDNTKWTIRRVTAVAMNQAFECLCQLQR